MNLLRRILGCLMGLGLAVAPGGTVVAQAWHPADTGRQAGWVWARLQQFDVPGARVSLQYFQAPVAPVQAARQLAAASGMRLTRLQFAGTVLWLSGGQGAEHWLAQLQPGAGGAIGLVSRLMPASAPVVGFDPAGLAPVDARRVFQVADRPPGDPASLSSFDCPGTLSQVAQTVGQALRAARWSAAEPASGAVAANASLLPAEWRHPDIGRLSVHLHARPGSVALTFRHHPKEPA